jgi:RHS repeat-associated protein
MAAHIKAIAFDADTRLDCCPAHPLRNPTANKYRPLDRHGQAGYRPRGGAQHPCPAAHRLGTYTYGLNGLPRARHAETVPQPYRFQGAYLDPTGLYKMGARYYDPVTTRFTQTDPSG